MPSFVSYVFYGRGSGSRQSARHRYLRQSVTVTGLETETVTNAVKAGTAIRGLFDRWFPEGKLEHWPSTDRIDELTASNRYFTPKDDALPGERHLAFGKLIDPHGILEDMAKDGYLHTEDNEVKYFARKAKANGDVR